MANVPFKLDGSQYLYNQTQFYNQLPTFNVSDLNNYYQQAARVTSQLYNSPFVWVEEKKEIPKFVKNRFDDPDKEPKWR